MRNLSSAFSVAASTTSVASRTAATSVASAMRPRAASRAAASIVPFFTWRSMFFSIVPRPRASASFETSIIVTGKPATAKTCAMPFPICPAPTTAMRSVMPKTPRGWSPRVRGPQDLPIYS